MAKEKLKLEEYFCLATTSTEYEPEPPLEEDTNKLTEDRKYKPFGVGKGVLRR